MVKVPLQMRSETHVIVQKVFSNGTYTMKSSYRIHINEFAYNNITLINVNHNSIWYMQVSLYIM